ncbi:MAG TPA: type 1 glutamine amidotransferase [Bauldia sp.]|nr:type 1 glutamine amidotransferase [Bauldia sp.]
MRVLVIENFVGTPLGQIEPALRQKGADIDLRQAWQGAPIPATDAGYDGIVVLGGEQSAVDDADYPYLPHLAELTRMFGAADKPVLGVCLGAQIVARGAGARNILGRPVEFGWHEVTPTAAGKSDPVLSALGESSPTFHWHLDTFTLPPGAVHLATSAQTEQQAFRIGRATYGIQFHFEADRKLVDRWSADFAGVIATYAPDWEKQRPVDAARSGARADALGAAIARAWVGLIR